MLRRVLLLAGAAFALGGCSSSRKTTDPAEPAFRLQLFSASSEDVDNPFFPLVPGAVHIHSAESEDGTEIIVVEVLAATRIVNGLECRVVRDRVFLDELLLEDTHDWYAQDMSGNVWYMGEEVVNYEYDDEGNLLGTNNDSAWEAGLDVAGVGVVAEPGILMKANPQPGDRYRQEFYAGQAEDRGEVVARNVAVTLPDGRRFTCLQIRDTNPLEPGSDEFKYFASGIGQVFAEGAFDGSDPEAYLGTFDTTPAALPDFAAATFTNPSVITHPHLQFVPETARTFVDEDEVIVVEALTETRIVNGVECAVVRDRVFVDELLVEDTHDWYAQDDDGNVWYMGEDVVNYEYDDEGNLLGTDSGGAWEAGVDGAAPGILMWANHVVGRAHFQEFYAGEAEDMAVVVATSFTAELPDGTMVPNTLRVLEWTPLEPDAAEFKHFAPGVGVVLEEPADGSGAVMALGTFDTSAASLSDVSAAAFSNPAEITNPYLPFTPGTTREFSKETEDGTEQIVIEVLATRVVDGVECRVVRDRVFLDGVLIEDTHDWFAQDDDGNVWYFGEEVVNYEYDDEGVLLGTDNEGAWEAGVDGAEAGILMWASPVAGRSYRQEFYEGEAEDMGLVVALGVTVTLENGTIFTNCLQVLEWTPLDPAALEYKFHAPGIGVVKEQAFDGEDPVEIVTD